MKVINFFIDCVKKGNSDIEVFLHCFVPYLTGGVSQAGCLWTLQPDNGRKRNPAGRRKMSDTPEGSGASPLISAETTL